MCDCIQKLEEKMVEIQPLKDKVVTKAKINTMLQFLPGRIVSRPVIECFLTVEGLKKEKTMNLAYSHCPFCGTAYDFEKKEEVDNG